MAENNTLNVFKKILWEFALQWKAGEFRQDCEDFWKIE